MKKYITILLTIFMLAFITACNEAKQTKPKHATGQLINKTLSGKVSKEDFEETLKLAEQGDAEAQYRLGTYYEYGLGTNVDEQKIIEWTTKSAEQGHVPAISQLAEWYFVGERYVEQDIPKALDYYKLAADKNDIFALYELGRIYLYGIDLERDMNESVRLLTLASEQDSTQAQMLLAEIYMGVPGVIQFINYDKAMELYKAVAQKDDAETPKAQYELAMLYFTEQDKRDEAMALLEKSAENGHDKAQAYLAELYLYDDDKKDVAKAIDLLFSAVEGNNAMAQFRLGYMAVMGQHLEQKIDIGEELLVASAKQGYEDAIVLLSMLYFHGDIIAKNIEKATYYAEIGAKNGDDKAQFILGMIYFFDNYNNAKLRKKGIEMIISSADQGNENAIMAYKKIMNAINSQ